MPKFLVIAGLSISLALICQNKAFGHQANSRDADVESQEQWRINAKLPEYNRATEPLDEELTRAMKDAVLNGIKTPGLAVDIPDEQSTNSANGAPSVGELTAFLQTLACKASAIVTAKVRSGSSHLSDDRSTVFTDYIMDASEVLTSDPKSAISPGKSFILTRIGGEIALGPGTLSFEHGTVPILNTNENYLLFLERVPQTGSYKSVMPNGTSPLMAKRTGYIGRLKVSRSWNNSRQVL